MLTVQSLWEEYGKFVQGLGLMVRGGMVWAGFGDVGVRRVPQAWP